MPSQDPISASKKQRSLVFLLIFFFIFLILLLVFFLKAIQFRKTPVLEITKTDHAMRGSIYSSDGFTLATSEKLYKVSINPQSIDPGKRDLFVTLFSIYTDIPQEDIEKKLERKGYTTLSYNIPTSVVANLKLLNYKLDSYKVFKEFESQGKIIQKMGISIEVSGYSRKYPYGNTMEPLIGYTQKYHQNDITRVKGIKGLEQSSQNYLEPKQDAKIKGLRDIGFNIIQSKNISIQPKQDGLDLTLNVSLKLQKHIEELLDIAKERFQAKEIIVGVMNSKNGKILALASSARFNPKNIRKQDYPSLNNNAVELSFEVGSIIKPIVYAILLEHNLIPSEETRIDLDNGVYRIGRHTIRDDLPRKNSTPRNILINSSNIGMIKLSSNLPAKDYLKAMQEYGFGRKTGIDLPYEETGALPSVQKLKGAYKASVSYGYGFRATFIQLLRAYASFSNGGFLLVPQTIDHLSNQSGKRYKIIQEQKVQIISPNNAKEVKTILRDIVLEGTGKNANIPNVIVGGKTGTARIFSNGEYTKRYNSSFFGFAEDEKNSYTIGVVVFDPDVDEGYYGSKTAAPIFKEVVNVLLEDNFLQPISKMQANTKLQQN